MFVSFRKWRARAKFIVLFVVLTILVYELFRFVGSWIEPAQRYREPIGKAVKAFRQVPFPDEPDTVLERLLFFYRYGE